jgi:SAM-dependent methyltransferase
MAVDKNAFYRQGGVARDYDPVRFGSAAGLLTHEREVAALKTCFSGREKLLELGCGTGRLLKALRVEGWDVMGLDQSAAMLAAGGLRPGPTILVADVGSIPLADATLDGAYTFRMTNHLPDLRPMLRECRRVLRPGGRLVFDTMRWSFLKGDWRRWGGRNHTVCDETVGTWLEQAGLELEAVSALFPASPYLIARLPGPVARWLLETGAGLGESRHAVALWRARRPKD